MIINIMLQDILEFTRLHIKLMQVYSQYTCEKPLMERVFLSGLRTYSDEAQE